MMVTLVGLGCGTAATTTAEGAAALEAADLILGAKRLLDALPDIYTHSRTSAIKPNDIVDILLKAEAAQPCVVFSGDTGFYSGTRRLAQLLRENGISFRILPGISSVQLLAARLGRPWQDWTLCSAHGVSCDPIPPLLVGKPVFFLTGGSLGPAQLCRQITKAGLGDLTVTVGERLSYEDEDILTGTAAEFAECSFAPLSVLLAEAAPVPEPRCSGLPDEAFIRGQVPMTKQEVRAAALAKLAVRPDDICWDVGGGTGSVSVELSLAAPRGQVWSVEVKDEACVLMEQNKEKFRCWNLHIVEGAAPEALAELPAPDAVFLGGTKGCMAPIVDLVLEKNPSARICISAIALETLAAATAALTAHGLTAEVTQISVSRTKAVGSHHLLTANNPVFLITGGGL